MIQQNLDPLTEFLLTEKGELPTEASRHDSNTIISRQSKLKRAAGQIASAEARKSNDPIYKKMTYYRDLYFKYREMIHKKYGHRGKTQARR